MTAYAGTLASPGVLTIGVDESPPPPLNFGLPGSPDFVGFEVDLTRAIAQCLGLGVTYVSELWSRILEDLRQGRLDLICTAATVTPERSKVVDFGDPYLDTELVIVVKGDGRLPTSADLAGADVGARIATVAEECARARLGRARIRTFDFNTDAYAALETGEVDAVIDDRPIATHFARSRPGLEIARVIEGTGSHYALMFAKGNDGLREAMNRALAELRADGTYERIHGTWFGEEPAPMALHEKKEAAMIARIWHGRTRAEHADTYLDYLKQTGVRDIRNLPGNLAVQVWRRLRGGEADFLFVSWWPSLEAIRGFAGDDLERAVYYPRDREYLLELEPGVEHYEVMVDETLARTIEGGPPVIARIWHGRTRAEHADAYLDYLKETPVGDVRGVPGNLGIQVWRRVQGPEAEFLFVSYWPSLEAVREFAGGDLEKAVYYPRDREYLLELEPNVAHYEVAVDARTRFPTVHG